MKKALTLYTGTDLTQGMGTQERDPAEEKLGVLREKERVLAETMLEAFVRRYATPCLENNTELSQAFATCLERSVAQHGGHPADTPGFLEGLAEDTAGTPQEVSYEVLKKEVNQAFAAGGVDAVVARIQGCAPVRPDEEVAVDRVVRTNMQYDTPDDGPWNEAFACTGYPEHVHTAEVHINPAFMYLGDRSYGRQLREDLADLAKDIVSAHPTTQAVLGTSWLLDTKQGERIGFHVIPEIEDRRDNGSYRMQMVKRDGTVDEALLQTYIAGKDLPYKVRLGHIPVREFLERYLPDDLRDVQLTLKEPLPEEATEQVICIRNERKGFGAFWRTLWPEVKNGARTVEDLFHVIQTECPTLYTFWSDHDLLTELRAVTEQLISEGIPLEAVDSDSFVYEHPDIDTRLRAFREREEQVLQDMGYKDVAVVIPSHVSDTKRE